MGTTVLLVEQNTGPPPGCERVLKRYNAIELAPDRLGWTDSMVIRGMRAMPIRVAR